MDIIKSKTYFWKDKVGIEYKRSISLVKTIYAYIVIDEMIIFCENGDELFVPVPVMFHNKDYAESAYDSAINRAKDVVEFCNK